MDVHRVGRSNDKRSQRIFQITKRRSSSSDSSSSNEPKKKSSKKKKKKKYRSCSSSSSSPIRKKKKRKHSSTSSSSSSERKRKKKEKKKKKKKKKKKERERMEKEKVSDRCSAQCITTTTTQISSPQVLPQSSLQSPKKRSMVPMTKEEYDRQQSIVRKMYDPDTGRNRLVKGDGEILEEIVSYARHKEINKISTKQDGESFSASLGLWKK